MSPEPGCNQNLCKRVKECLFNLIEVILQTSAQQDKLCSVLECCVTLDTSWQDDDESKIVVAMQR